MSDDPITAKRHYQTYSVELLDATAVITAETRDTSLYNALSRLTRAFLERFDLPDIRTIHAQDPGRKTAVRISIQLVDEGASDTEIRKLHRLDLAAFDEFVDRERPKLLKRGSKGKPQ